MIIPNYKKVESEVERVLKENAIAQLPISPEEIAQSYGIKVEPVVFRDQYKDVAGFFDFKEKKIYVNSEDPYNRITFTIAHELGHYFLHQQLFEENPDKYSVLLRRPMGATHDPLEKEANAFAANLLVPQKFLNKYVHIASIDDLANLFVVSPEVIRNRLKREYDDL